MTFFRTLTFTHTSPRARLRRRPRTPFRRQSPGARGGDVYGSMPAPIRGRRREATTASYLYGITERSRRARPVTFQQRRGRRRILVAPRRVRRVHRGARGARRRRRPQRRPADVRPPPRALRPVRHGDVGAILVLRHAGAAGAVHARRAARQGGVERRLGHARPGVSVRRPGRRRPGRDAGQTGARAGVQALRLYTAPRTSPRSRGLPADRHFGAHPLIVLGAARWESARAARTQTSS